jgi:uncharacterized membrane protein YgdD (TMEM256/DUF423 family)
MESYTFGIILLVIAIAILIAASVIAGAIGAMVAIGRLHKGLRKHLPTAANAAGIAFFATLLLSCIGFLIWNPKF